VNLLPNVFGFILAATIAGILLTKYGRYRPWHFGGLAVMSIGMGLYSLLNESTPTYGWVLLVFFFAMGCGFVMPSLVSSLQANLTDLDTAAAMAAITITRNFGSIFGALISSTIFNNVFDRFADRIQDEATRAKFIGGQAYGLAIGSYINSLPSDTRSQVISTYMQTLKYVWYAGIAVCLAALLCVFLEREIDLRTTLDSDFSLKQETFETSTENPTPSITL
jgi:MFS family permease